MAAAGGVPGSAYLLAVGVVAVMALMLIWIPLKNAGDPNEPAAPVV